MSDSLVIVIIALVVLLFGWRRYQVLRAFHPSTPIPWSEDVTREVMTVLEKTPPAAARKHAQMLADLPRSARAELPPEVRARLEELLGKKID